MDLHSHTVFSDGLLPPGELVRAAARVGVKVLALTDHDTTAGVPAALDEAGWRGIRLIPGMEVSSYHGERNLHILAYFGADALDRLTDWQDLRRAARNERLEEILDRLSALGVDAPRDLVREGADPRGTPGRPHVARALVQTGQVQDSQEAFDRYLAKGRPAYVGDRGPSAAAAIAMIHRLPGLAVVAHPVHDDLDPVFEELVALGLDGIEAYHSSHDPDTAARFHQRARDLDLLVTGGSDFHGDPAIQGRDAEERLGRVALPIEDWLRFDAALERRVSEPTTNGEGGEVGEGGEGGESGAAGAA